MHPRFKHWHTIDLIITRHRDKKTTDFSSTRVMRGANCRTDHQILRSKAAIHLGHNKQDPKRPTKLNTTKHKAADMNENLLEAMNVATRKLEEVHGSSAEQNWTKIGQTYSKLSMTQQRLLANQSEGTKTGSTEMTRNY